MFNATGNFNGMLGKVAHGMCRLSMNGDIAVKTNNGYKTYNLKTGRLVNCSNFVFDIGEDLFFVLPTNKVNPGDIILVSGKPKCVIEVEKNGIKVINYEDSTLETILPERHILLGNTYFYGKICSMFGNNLKGGKGVNHMMKYMMLSEMMKDKNGISGNNMLPLMMMGNGGFDGIFDGMFDFDYDEDDENDEEQEDEN